jgi:hypothetical protein
LNDYTGVCGYIGKNATVADLSQNPREDEDFHMAARGVLDSRYTPEIDRRDFHENPQAHPKTPIAQDDKDITGHACTRHRELV